MPDNPYTLAANALARVDVDSLPPAELVAYAQTQATLALVDRLGGNHQIERLIEAINGVTAALRDQ